jgi:hypothetical protein
MSLGQSALAAMALVVITFLVVSANRIIIQSRQDELKGEAYNQAGEIASELINEALKKKYDDPTVTHHVDVNKSVWNPATSRYEWVGTVYYKLYDFYEPNNAANFTPMGSLGPEGTEKTAVPHTLINPDRYPFKSIAGYNDFDDYNGYVRIVDTPIMNGFVVKCTVYYIASLTLTPAPNSTYTKRLVVKVSQPTYLPDTLSFSTTMTY